MSDSTVYAVKIITGEEIIGTITTNMVDGSITIKNPVNIVMVDQGQLALVPYMPILEKKEVTISNSFVVTKGPVISNIRDQYIKATTGIVTPSATGLKLTK